MKTYASIGVVFIAMAAGMSGANADDRELSRLTTLEPVRATVATREGRPQGSGMQKRDGDFSWCSESGGGLTCGSSQCYESEVQQMSVCDKGAWNTSDDPDYP